jgi:hypothetical protein
VPRYRDEQPPLDVAHPWAYDWNAAPVFDPARDAALLAGVRATLDQSRRT